MAKLESVRRIALIGLMGAGKSATARVLARRLGWPVVDLDDAVEAAAGLSVAAIFRQRGEAGFRAAERESLRAALHGPAPMVLAAGGGAVLDPENRRTLSEHALVVWLPIPPVEAARRTAGSDRPLLAGGGDPVTVLAELAAAREPLYRACADVTLDWRGAVDPEDLVARLAAQVPEIRTLIDRANEGR